jgi:HK97 family phage major capsid protein
MPSTKTYHREFQLDAALVDIATRTVPLSFSSEQPVLRDFGWEVLSHKTGSIDDTYIKNGLALLDSHNPAKQLGTVRKIRLVNKRLIGESLFGSSPESQAALADAKDGIRTSTSFGYTYSERDIKHTGTHADGNPIFTVQKFTPFEVSLVAIPADPSVGVGRSHPTLKGKNMTTQNDETEHQSRSEARRDNSQVRELQRRDDLRAWGDNYRSEGGPEIARQLIESGGTVQDLKSRVLALMQARSEATTRALSGGGGFGGPFEERGFEQSQGDSAHFRDGEISGGVPVAMKGVYGASKRGLWAFGENTREQQHGAYKAGMFLASVIGNPEAQKWIKQRGYNMRAASTSNNTAGGFAVPEEMSNAVISNRDVFGVARKIVRVVPMGSDSTTVPVQASAVSTYYIGENSALSESDITWGQVGLVAKKLAVMGRFSSEVLEDAVLDMASYYAAETGRAFAEAEDDAFINGDGTSSFGGQSGLIYRIENETLAGEVTAATNHDLFSEIDASDLASLVALCPAYALTNARWLMSPAFYGAVIQRLILSAGGLTLNDMQNGQLASFLGYPISISPKMPNSTTTDYSNKVVCMFGDFSRSTIIGTRRDITVMVDPSRYMEYDQVAIRSTQRWVVVNHDLGTSTTKSPVVALLGQ